MSRKKEPVTVNIGKSMTKSETIEFVKNLGRSELYDEIERTGRYTAYFKGARTVLWLLGYDREWIINEFCPAFRDEYNPQLLK